jgi:hypothetical protein
MKSPLRKLARHCRCRGHSCSRKRVNEQHGQRCRQGRHGQLRAAISQAHRGSRWSPIPRRAFPVFFSHPILKKYLVSRSKRLCPRRIDAARYSQSIPGCQGVSFPGVVWLDPRSLGCSVSLPSGWSACSWHHSLLMRSAWDLTVISNFVRHLRRRLARVPVYPCGGAPAFLALSVPERHRD